MTDPKIRYLEAALNGASPERRLQLLVEGALNFIIRARHALAEGGIESCHNDTMRAQNIYLELLIALDPEAGDFVTSLRGLYYLLYEVLLEANVTKDDTLYAQAEQMAEGIRSMWDEALRLAQGTAVVPVADDAPRRLNVAG